MSSTSGSMGATYFQEVGPRFFDMSSARGYMGEKYFQEFGPRFFDMSSASGYMGATCFQEFGPIFCWHVLLPHLQRGVDFCCQTGLHRGGYNYEI